MYVLYVFAEQVFWVKKLVGRRGAPELERLAKSPFKQLKY